MEGSKNLEKNLHVEKKERVAEQVDEVDGDPAEEEDDADAPEKFFRPGHPKSLLMGGKRQVLKYRF